MLLPAWQSFADTRVRITDYITRVTVYAASGIMAQVRSYDDLITIESDKVGGWLMNEEATEWEHVSIPAGLQIASTNVW